MTEAVHVADLVSGDVLDVEAPGGVVTAVTLAGGTTVVLAVDDEGKLWHYRPVGSTSYWRSLGDQDLVGPVTTVAVQQGVQLFARDTAGAIRTALYATDGSGRAHRGEIHHLPWPLQPAEAELEPTELVRWAGLRLRDTAPVLHFSRRLDVVAWAPVVA